MLLVDDDQAEFVERGEDGGAGADDDFVAAVLDVLPDEEAVAGAHGGVDEGDLRAEETSEVRKKGSGQSDFGDHDHDGFALREDFAGDMAVDEGFAGAGDAVNQGRGEAVEAG